jgi:uncharacterized surface protein with fasciclin (FAS1) repeats
MTSIQGNHEAYDYTHMYNVKDLQGRLPLPVIVKDTIMELLVQKNMTMYIMLLDRAGLTGFINNTNFRGTLFVPLDFDDVVINMDTYYLKKLINYHTLEKPLTQEFIQKSRLMKVNTKSDKGSYITIENVGNYTILNGESSIVEAYSVGHAQVYMITKFVCEK